MQQGSAVSVFRLNTASGLNIRTQGGNSWLKMQKTKVADNKAAARAANKVASSQAAPNQVAAAASQATAAARRAAVSRVAAVANQASQAAVAVKTRK
jgi:hypothetical protein